jgi:long-chain acyl-CoA synthetase
MNYIKSVAVKTIIELFETSVQKYSDHIYLWEKHDGAFRGTTYAETREQVLKLGAGLQKLGLQKGDRTGLISEGRNAWIISELAVLYAGGANVPLSVKLDAASELKFRLNHSGAKMVFVSNAQAHKIEEIRKELTNLEKIIYLDGKENPEEGDIAYEDILKMGEEALKKDPESFHRIRKNIQPGDLANISYTSGTTADPKGIMLSHLNYAANVVQSNTLMEITPEWKTLAILPWDHAFAHTACLYCFMYNGASVASLEQGRTALETLKNIPKNIKEIKPHVLMSVPALAKNFRKGIESNIKAKGKTAEKLFTLALKTAYKYNGLGYNKGKGFRIVYKPLLALFDTILFSKIREGFGGNLQFFIGGGALLDIELQRFFYAVGMPMCQGYGLSEASPVISSNALHAIKFGSSGKLVKYLDLKIVDDNDHELPTGQKGEIVVKGDNVMVGYWNNPKATRETIKDGWLYTGDMGYMDAEGFLYVLGRFKSLLIANDGEKFSPEGIEEAITDQSRFIDQVILYNNQNPYTVGFIVPNVAAIKQELVNRAIHPNTKKGDIEALQIIQREINAYRLGGKYSSMFPERWIPATLAVLPEACSEQNGLVNSTMKIVRDKVTARYAKELQFLYTSEAKNIVNSMNLEAIKKWNF